MRLPKYRIHKPSGRAVVEHNKERQYLPGKYNSPESLAAYDEFIEHLQLNAIAAKRGLSSEQSPMPGASNLVVAELLVAYFAWANEYYAGTPELFHLRSATKSLKAAFGMSRVVDFGPLNLKRIRGFYVQELGWTRKQVNDQIGRLIRIFAWGVEEQMVPPDVVAALREVRSLRKGKTIARESRKVTAVTWSIVHAVQPYLSPVVWDMVCVQYFSGMRSAELTRLTERDLDRSDSVWVYRPPGHKTDYLDLDKIICFGPRAQKILTQHFNADPDAFLFRPADAVAWKHEQRDAARTTPRRAGHHTKTAGELTQHRSRYTSSTYRRAIVYGFEKAAKQGVRPRRRATSRPCRGERPAD